MPFLHFETSEGYDRMSEAILDTKTGRRKEVQIETGTQKGNPNVKVNEEEKEEAKETREKAGQTKGEQSKKVAKKDQVVENEKEGSLSRDVKPSFGDEGRGEGSGSGIGGTGADSLLSTADEKGETRQKASHSATNTRDELSYEELYSAGDGRPRSTSDSHRTLNPSGGDTHNVSEHQADPVPNYVIVSEAGRSMFDFPQQKETQNTQLDQGKVKKSESTLTSTPVQNTQPDSRKDKGKRQDDTNPGNITEKKAINFTDAIGRKFSYPFHLCFRWAVSIWNS
jgi:hypothetical protein